MPGICIRGFLHLCRIKLHKLQYGKELVFSEMKPPNFEGDSLGKQITRRNGFINMAVYIFCMFFFKQLSIH